MKDLEKEDVLSQLQIKLEDESYELYELYGMESNEVYELIQYQPTPFTLIFERNDLKCVKHVIDCCAKAKCCQCLNDNIETTESEKQCCQNTKTNLKKCAESLKDPSKWFFRVGELAVGLGLKGLSIYDIYTDLVLLYTASINGAITYTIIFLTALLVPYALSYSSGVHIFLYRKTFENIKLGSSKSFLLALYLFPTGIIYFILLDVINIILQIYMFFAYGCLRKIKSEEDIVQIESNVAKSFGMSRMDWVSIQKQQAISQVLLSIHFLGICHRLWKQRNGHQMIIFAAHQICGVFNI